jgi:site-specific recombinase XerD
MYDNGINTYTPVVGTVFIADYLSKHNLGISRQKAIKTMINRLNDYYNCTDYALQRKQEISPLTEIYEELLESYLSYCTKNGNKDGTIIKKRLFCSGFLKNLSDLECHELNELTSSHVCKACVKVQNKDAWAAIRTFLKYLNLSDLVKFDYSTLVPRYKRANIIPVTYSINEVNRFETAIDRSTATGKRDYAMLLLATRLGMRSGDIVKLSLDELDFFQDTIHLIQEKNSQPLVLTMLPEIKEALDDYIKNGRPEVNKNYVFLRMNAPHQRITTSAIRFATTGYFNKAGINISGKKHGPHTFRSSLASSMVNDNIPYDVVRSILGHTDPDAVKHYAKLDIERLRGYAIEVPKPSGIFKEFLEGGMQS